MATMDIRRILAKLHAQRSRLDEAIAAIERLNGTGKTPGRSTGTRAGGRRRRRMSAAARKRLSELLKKRWAHGKMGARASKK